MIHNYNEALSQSLIASFLEMSRQSNRKSMRTVSCYQAHQSIVRVLWYRTCLISPCMVDVNDKPLSSPL